MYDVLIVGARTAGAPLALLLARAGRRVLLVDRTSFPSDTLSGHYIHQPGIAALARWGLLERLVASGCPPIERITLDLGQFVFGGTPPPFEGTRAGYCPRRTVLDSLLVDAARAAGAEVREGVTISELIVEDGRVCGARGRMRSGAPFEERAHLVVGADGMRSKIAELVGANAATSSPGTTCNYYTYWSGVPVSGVELSVRDGCFFVAAPTHGGETVLNVGWKRAEFERVRSEIETSYFAALELVPDLARRVHAGRRASRWFGTSELPSFVRQGSGPGWALAGDARCHMDPITAQGMSNAFLDAETLAKVVDETWTAASNSPAVLDSALATYALERELAVRPMYELTTLMATLEPPPAMMTILFEALRGNQPAIDRYLGTLAGTVSFADFFASLDPGEAGYVLRT
jgi:2-polyprenyl-6-methoxyphenol hydroxylase-like FAD-dependent oxidoreductase